jgi:hypothetical protein
MNAQSSTNPVYKAWIKLRGNLPLEPLQFARYAFDAIVEGNAVTIKEAASALGLSLDQARQHVKTVRGWGLMTVKDDVVTGSLGLTSEPTQYEIELNGRSMHVWCALDAVGIPAALGADASIHVRGLADVQIKGGRLERAEPKTLRISLNDPNMAPDMKAEVCPTICFHPQAGKPHPSMTWLSVEDAMDLGRVIWARPSSKNAKPVHPS